VTRFLYRVAKRAMDVTVAALALIVLLPVITIVAALVRLLLGTPVIFRQVRPGLHAQPVEVLKFRTMTDERDASGELLPDERRLTRFGMALRKTSLDELPQLVNVLRGDLSLVGPRPLLLEYLQYYNAQEMRRHSVRPGLTGWAQVNGRNAISWQQRFAYDAWYVDNASLALDLIILWITLRRVIESSGVTPPHQPIMERFRGTRTAQHLVRRDDLVGQSLAVISDIHANAEALAAALAQARDRDARHCVVLGDLLTYGAEPHRVLDLLEQSEMEIIAITGNHDVMYPSGAEEYVSALPEYIRDSVTWTRRTLRGRVPRLKFLPQVAVGDVLFAHANPFAFGDWTYLNAIGVIEAAAATLRLGGFAAGVFGHTHRRRITVVSPGKTHDIVDPQGMYQCDEQGTVVINAGSVGQPRGTGSSMLFVQAGSVLSCEFVRVYYDVWRHTQAISESDLPESAKARICRYFEAESLS